jgi:type III secretion protein S
MNAEALTSSLNQTLAAYMVLALPPLIAALIIGLVIGLLQAVTQIQDQSIPQILKILTVFVVLSLFTPLLMGPLVALTEYVFTIFPTATR